MRRKRVDDGIVIGSLFLYNFSRRKVTAMPEYVERLVACGINLADAYEICDDYIYDLDYAGLAAYVRAVELASGTV